jgi:hypothetical protein
VGFGPKQIKKKADGYAEDFCPYRMFFLTNHGLPKL